MKTQRGNVVHYDGFGAALFARTTTFICTLTHIMWLANSTLNCRMFTNKLSWIFLPFFSFQRGIFYAVFFLSLFWCEFQSGNIKLIYWERAPLILNRLVADWSNKRIWQWHWNRATNCLMPNHRKTHATCTNKHRHSARKLCIFNLCNRMIHIANW